MKCNFKVTVVLIGLWSFCAADALFCQSVIVSQYKMRDSLLQSVISIEGNEKVNTLNELAWITVYSNPKESHIYSKSALNIAKKNGYKTGECVSLNRIGVGYDIQGKYDSALIYYHDALTLARKINDTRQIAGSLSNIGLTHWHIGNLNDASKYFFSALNFFEIDDNIKGLASTYNNLGLVYQSHNNLPRALVFFNKAQDNYIRIENQAGNGAVLTNMGQVFLRQGLYLKAQEYLKESIRIKKSIDDHYGLSISYNSLASVFMESGNYARAAECAFQAAQYAGRINDNHELAGAYLKLSMIFLRQNKLNSAIKYNKMSEQIAGEIHSNKLFFQVYKNYADIYEVYGDLGKSLEWYKKYKETEDSVLNSTRYNNIYELELKYATEKSKMEIVQLNRQKNIQDLQIEKQRLTLEKRNNLIIFSFTLFVAGLLIIYIFYLNYRHKQKVKLEKALHLEKEERAREVLEAELCERKRMGEELHDGMGQILSLIKLTLTSLEKKGDLIPSIQQKLVKNAIELTDTAFSELRNISHNLAPVFLREKGLDICIRKLLERLIESNKFRVNMDFSKYESCYDNFVELTIYRTVQEICNNIILHANATEINFQLLQDDDELTIMIEDNGKGFNEEHSAFSQGIGLRNIYSRIKNIGGIVHLDTAIERGTIFTIIIPRTKTKYGKDQTTYGG
jgi:signal transduction histidine kinase